MNSKLFIFFKRTLFIGLFLFLSLFCLLQIKEVQLFIVNSTETLIEKHTGYSVRIDEPEFLFPFEIRGTSLRISKNSEEVFFAKKINLRLKLISIIKKALIFRSIQMEGVIVSDRFLQESSGDSVLSEFVVPDIAFTAGVRYLSVTHLQIPSLTNKIIDLEGSIEISPKKIPLNLSGKIAETGQSDKTFILKSLIEQKKDRIDLTAAIESNEGFTIENKHLHNILFEITLSGKKEIRHTTDHSSKQIISFFEGNFSACGTGFTIPLTISADIKYSPIVGLSLKNFLGTFAGTKLSGNAFIDTNFVPTEINFSLDMPEIQNIAGLLGVEKELLPQGTVTMKGGVRADTYQFNITASSLQGVEYFFENAQGTFSGTYNSSSFSGSEEITFLYHKKPVSLTSRFFFDKAKGLSIKDPVLTYDSGSIGSELLSLSLDGIVTGTAEGNLTQLASIAYIFSLPITGSGSFTFKAYPTEENPLMQSGSFTMKGSGIQIEECFIESLLCSGSIDDLYSSPKGVLEISAKKIKRGGIFFESGGFKAAMNGSLQNYEIFARGPGSDFIGKGTWNFAEKTKILSIENFNGNYKGEAFSLKKTGFISLDQTVRSLSPISLQVGNGSIAGFFRYSPEGIRSKWEITNIPVLFFTEEVYGDSIQGNISGNMLVEGKEYLSGNLEINIADLQFENANTPPLNGSIQISLNERFATLESLIFSEENFPISIKGKFPVQISLFPPQFLLKKQEELFCSFQASGKIAPLIEFFGAENFTLTGKGRIDGTVKGTLDSPIISGNANIEQANFEYFSLGTSLKNLEAHFEGNNEKIILTSLTADDNVGGRVTGTGELAIEPGEGFSGQLRLLPEKLLILDIENITGAFTGTVDVTGNNRKIFIQSDLEAEKVGYAIPKKIGDITDPVDVIYVNQNPMEPLPTAIHRNSQTAIPVEFDLRISIPNILQINDGDLNSLWKGNLILSGTPDKISPKGELSLTKGSYLLNGQKFELKQGSISFSGDFEKKATLYIVASRDIHDYRIDIVLQGPVSNPNIILRSSPALPQQEVLSLILFGKSPSEISAFQDEQLEQSLSGLLKEQSGPGLVSKLQQTIGIDRIDINRQECGTGEVSIGIGKYLTRDLYISLKKGFGDEPTRLSLEAKLHRDVKIQIDAGESDQGSSDTASGQISLFWQHDY